MNTKDDVRLLRASARDLREQRRLGAAMELEARADEIERGIADHEHDGEWVDVSEMQDQDRVEMCTVPGCGVQRTVPRG